MDTLWWYDGTSKWYPTTLRSSILGTKAPAYAVLVDPTDASAVYVGTALGVWKGALSFAGSDPHWDWTNFSNGLPETAVQDLSFYSKGNIKLLRAALQARGVWEVDLSAAPGPTKRTFLRVHPNDARRQSPTALANPMKDGPGTWLWFSSPDLRIRPARALYRDPVLSRSLLLTPFRHPPTCRGPAPRRTPIFCGSSRPLFTPSTHSAAPPAFGTTNSPSACVSRSREPAPTSMLPAGARS